MATEKRLIDANELVRKTNKLDVFYFTGETDIQMHDCQMVELGAVLAEIDEAHTVDALEVVYCDNCVNHGNCLPEDVFRMARIEKPYCCAGKMDGDGNG